MFLIASSRHATACFNKHGDTTDVAHERSDPPIASKKKVANQRQFPSALGDSTLHDFWRTDWFSTSTSACILV